MPKKYTINNSFRMFFLNLTFLILELSENSIVCINVHIFVKAEYSLIAVLCIIL